MEGAVHGICSMPLALLRLIRPVLTDILVILYMALRGKKVYIDIKYIIL